MKKHKNSLLDKTVNDINVTHKEYIAHWCGNDPRLVIQNEHLKSDKYDISVIEAINEITELKKYNKKHKIRINRQIYAKTLDLFVKTLSHYFDEEELTNLYNNVKNLKFEHVSELESFIGKYDLEKNKILLKVNAPIKIIIHELFHMASANCSYFPGNGGFRLLTDDRKKTIGNGLDEGYTDKMTHRYFFRHGKANKVVTYSYEYLIVSALEYVIGQRTMEKSYLKADLYGLICEMLMYSNKTDIELFLKNTDYAVKNRIIKTFSMDSSKEDKEYLMDRMDEIANFLLDIFYEKYKDDENYEDRLQEFKSLMTQELPLHIEEEFRYYSRDISLSLSDSDYIDNYLKQKTKTNKI